MSEYMLKIWLLSFLEDVELIFESEDAKLSNTRFETVSAVVHGNGPSKV